MTAPGASTPDLLAQFRALNEQFLAAWGQAAEAFLASAAGQDLTRETRDTYLATRAALARTARETWGPIIEAAGAVPLAEFQRLADQVQLILQRLDRIDDALAALLEAQQAAPAPAPAPRKSRKKSA
ncbi:hypothetical protein [Tepidiforma sp.]|uniref:hypothetical protein n=1 Tax=Tepidiforma sp. TaxID=2682230 RepID=UPI002ADE4219|nr:hypothetical protein [Tepidiforma sp.]